jgi:hypothetical protein
MNGNSGLSIIEDAVVVSSAGRLGRLQTQLPETIYLFHCCIDIFAGLPQPKDCITTLLVNISHLAYLPSLFLVIVLIDTKSINPN